MFTLRGVEYKLIWLRVRITLLNIGNDEHILVIDK